MRRILYGVGGTATASLCVALWAVAGDPSLDQAKKHLESITVTQAVGANANPVGMVSPLPMISPKTITPTEGKILAREFARAQKTELQALNHRQKIERDELRAALKAKEKEFESREKSARHEFFEKTKKGSERRTYVAAFLERRKSIRKTQADEKSAQAQEQEKAYRALKASQAENAKQYEQYIKQGMRPPSTLWPKAGY